MRFFDDKVKTFIEQHKMIQPGDHLAAAVSGGIDSMVLLAFLHDQQERLGISVSAIHVDHMLRGEESYADLLFVQAYCREKGIPFWGRQADAAAEAARSRTGIQQAARHVRYELFQKGMQELGANKLATAHHADDQTETVLMQLARGSHSYSGIPVIRPFAEGQMIRPFLSVMKEDIEGYAAEQAVLYRQDPSNDKETYTRNRFRKQALPFLKMENRKAPLHVQRFAQERQEDEVFLRSLAEEKVQNMSIWKQESVSLQIKPFLKVPLPLQRRAIHLILNYLYHGKTAFSFLHIQDILHLLQSAAPSGTLTLPAHLTVSKIADHCLFAYEIDQEPDDQPALLREGECVHRKGMGTFTLAAADDCSDEASCFRLKEEAALPIWIRTRQQGDRMQLRGMNGSKKLSRLLIDEKIPLAYREHIPVVTDASGTILWIPGIRKSVHEGDGPLLLIYEKE